MTLDDALEEVELSDEVEVLTGEILPKDEEFEEEDFEEGLLNALSLLDDCVDIMEEVIDPNSPKVTYIMLKRMERVALEVRGFLQSYEKV